MIPSKNSILLEILYLPHESHWFWKSCILISQIESQKIIFYRPQLRKFGFPTILISQKSDFSKFNGHIIAIWQIHHLISYKSIDKSHLFLKSQISQKSNFSEVRFLNVLKQWITKFLWSILRNLCFGKSHWFLNLFLPLKHTILQFPVGVIWTAGRTWSASCISTKDTCIL